MIIFFSISASLVQSAMSVLVWSWVQVGVVDEGRVTVGEAFDLGAAWTNTTPRRLASARWRSFIVVISYRREHGSKLGE
jgi:hypothetical protein